VVDHRRIDDIVRDVYGEENPALERVSDVKLLASKLIEKGVLTLWQIEMLLLGRWKGFVKDGYELRDAFCARTEEQPFVFLARRVDFPDTEYLIEFASWDAPISVICSRPRSRSLSEWPAD
jgi:hypothetical protein